MNEFQKAIYKALGEVEKQSLTDPDLNELFYRNEAPLAPAQRTLAELSQLVVCTGNPGTHTDINGNDVRPHYWCAIAAMAVANLARLRLDHSKEQDPT